MNLKSPFYHFSSVHKCDLTKERMRKIDFINIFKYSKYSLKVTTLKKFYIRIDFLSFHKLFMLMIKQLLFFIQIHKIQIHKIKQPDMKISIHETG